MKNFLKLIDFIGKPIVFQIQGNEKFKSALGGVFSLILFAIVLFSFFYFGRDLYEKKNPSYLTQNTRLEFSPQWNLTNDNFFIGIRVEDENFTTVEDPRFFEIIQSYIHYERNSRNEIEVKNKHTKYMRNKCNDTHMKNHLNMKRPDGTGGKNQDFSNFFCPDIKYLIGGDFTENFFGSLIFKLKICDTDTERRLNITCATDEERFRRFKNKFYLGKVTHNHIINPSEYENPIIQTFDYTVQKLELDFNKQTFINFAINYLRTDSGVFSQEFQEKKFLQIDSERPDFTKRVDDNVIAECHILMSRNSNKYMRNYIKLQQVFAIVGGFVSISMNILIIIYSVYINSIYYRFIYQSLINIDRYVHEDSMKNEINSIKSIKIEKNMTKSPERLIPTEYRQNLSRTPIRKKFELKFGQSVIDSLFRKIMPVKGIKKLDSKNIRFLIKKEISDKFDLLNYFKLSGELHVLKRVLLNPEQNLMLSKKRKDNFDDLVSKNSSSANKKDLIKSIQDKIKTNNMSSIDKLLYSYLDAETKSLIHKVPTRPQLNLIKE